VTAAQRPEAGGRRRGRPSHGDHETRERLLHKAAQLFSERGFKRVTVRALCQATGANVAAVNYHFGSKLGLYREVVRTAIGVMRTTYEAAVRAGEGCGAEARLRAFIRVYLERGVGRWDGSWIHKLISREMADPTPALDLMVSEVLRPRMEYLCHTVSELMGEGDDEAVRHCAASIHAQWLVYAPGRLRNLLFPSWQATPERIQRLTAYVTEFSLAGIRGLLEGREKQGG